MKYLIIFLFPAFAFASAVDSQPGNKEDHHHEPVTVVIQLLNQSPDDVVQLANPDVDVLVTGFPPFPPENYPYITWDEWNEWAHKYIQWRCTAVTTKNEEIYACNRWLPELNHLKIGVDEFWNLIE